jgi:hypothetical protein
MGSVLAFLIAVAGVYAGYLIIRGGFKRPQSEKWNVYGIVFCILLLILALSYIFNP